MKQQANAAMFDLFDNGSDSQPGERQTDIEAIIAERSLLDMIAKGDTAAEENWMKQAKAGQIVRII